MTDKMIIAVLGLIGALIVVLKPIFDLNTNITELKVSIDAFKESVDKLDNRITEHGKEIDKLKESVAHSVRTGADMTQSERCGSMTIRQSAPYLIPMVFALFRMRYWSTEVRSWSILSALFWFLTSFQTA